VTACGLCGGDHFTLDEMQTCRAKYDAVLHVRRDAYGIPSLAVSRLTHFRTMHMRGEA
jgi:hypothetical protein